MKKDKTASFKRSTSLPWVEMRVASHSSACYQSHSHDEFSFGLITQGRALYKNRDKTHQISQGDLVSINPGDVHSCNPEAGDWSYSMLFVDANRLGELQTDISGKSESIDYLAFESDLMTNDKIKTMYESLFCSLATDSHPLTVQEQLTNFVALVFGEGVADKKRPTLQIDQVRQRLLDDISDTPSLEVLAKDVGLSRYQLLRAFQSNYGLPPYAYVIDEKIKRSKSLLKSGMSISQIALELGFSDQAHFQRHFRKKLAVTPAYYQSHFIE